VKIRVLGCHGSEQLVTTGRNFFQCRPCSFLINDTVLLDAGTISGGLMLEEQQRIEHVLLSHAHFDHIQGLPTLADNLARTQRRPVFLSGIEEVLNQLSTNVFNDAIFPNFFKLPTPQYPTFQLQPLLPRRPLRLSNLEVIAIPVNHVVPTTGFLIRDDTGTLLYSGDTSTTDEIWKIAAQDRTLKAAFIETSWPDELADLALASKHLTPTLLKQELHKLGRPDVAVYIYHMKPHEELMIERQLNALHIPRLSILREGQEIIV